LLALSCLLSPACISGAPTPLSPSAVQPRTPAPTTSALGCSHARHVSISARSCWAGLGAGAGVTWHTKGSQSQKGSIAKARAGRGSGVGRACPVRQPPHVHAKHRARATTTTSTTAVTKVDRGSRRSINHQTYTTTTIKKTRGDPLCQVRPLRTDLVGASPPGPCSRRRWPGALFVPAACTAAAADAQRPQAPPPPAPGQSRSGRATPPRLKKGPCSKAHGPRHTRLTQNKLPHQEQVCGRDT